MDSDVAYAIQIDKKEAYEGRRRGGSRGGALPAPLGLAAAATAGGGGSRRAHAWDLSAHEPVWETGLFTCWDASAFHCFLAVVLPCAIASHVEAMIDRSTFGLGAFFLGIAFLVEIVCATQSIQNGVFTSDSEQWTTLYVNERLKINMWGVAALVATAMFAGGVFAFRNMTRHYYRIPGSCCADAAIAVACAPCSMAQVSRHFEKAGRSVYATSGPTALTTSALIPVDTIPGYEASSRS